MWYWIFGYIIIRFGFPQKKQLQKKTALQSALKVFGFVITKGNQQEGLDVVKNIQIPI